MAWQNPKTDWVANPKNPVPEDFNRIEGNIDFLKSDIETKKGLIVAAINDMNQPAQVTDTHAQLASKIRDISKDATAAVGDVEKGKTFYSGGQKRTGTLTLSGTAGSGDVLTGKTFYNTDLKTKRTGTMPNRGAVVITPSTSNQTIQAGYHNGQGYVKGDPNLNAANIRQGISLFGVSGILKEVKFKTGSVENIPVNNPVYISANMGFYPDAIFLTGSFFGFYVKDMYGTIVTNVTETGNGRKSNAFTNVTSTGFTVSYTGMSYSGGLDFTWYAFVLY